MSTRNSIPNNGGSTIVQVGGTATNFLSSSDPLDINISAAGRYIISVDTSGGDYDTGLIDLSNIPQGTELIFKKISNDDNIIIDGENDHTDKEGENVCLVFNGTDLIVI